MDYSWNYGRRRCCWRSNWKSVAVAGVSGFVSGAIAAILLGLPGQVIAGTLIGSSSYVADCVVNKKPIAVDEFLVSTIGGAVSGYIGGPGANENMILTRTIEASNKTISRMSTRECTSYATKQIASAKAWTKVKDWFSNLFK